jgi:hypothetical protein
MAIVRCDIHPVERNTHMKKELNHWDIQPRQQFVGGLDVRNLV